MVTEAEYSGRRTPRAVGYFSVTIIFGSLISLVIAWSDGVESPFLFNSGMTFGVVIGCLFFLFANHRDVVSDRRVLKVIWQRMFHWRIACTTAANFNFAFFAWSASFVDISITAILFEIWPLFVIYLTRWDFKEEGRYRRISFGVWLLLALGVVGFIFVVSSQHGGLYGLAQVSSFALIPGVVWATLSAILTALTAFSFKWGTGLIERFPDEAIEGKDAESIELLTVAIAYLVANLVSTPTNATIGLMLGEAMDIRTLLIAALAGGSANIIASLSWRKANLITDNLGINAMVYSTPIFSLLWLFLFWNISIERVDYLVVGAAGIITVNVLINVYESPRPGVHHPAVSDNGRLDERVICLDLDEEHWLEDPDI